MKEKIITEKEFQKLQKEGKLPSSINEELSNNKGEDE